ncbi:MAG: DNA-3-methyladenine glycosylase I [Proteobacteria bacterium]|nr:DNA-3-methyladenine glycosylase I [Pseudomonadota bacterium]
MERCSWCLKDSLYMDYHDKEWGLPLRDETKLFEMLILESMQAGLSWYTVLKKRPAMEKAFFHFNPQKLANLTEEQLTELLNNEGIIRNRLKIKSVQTNAKAFLKVAARENIIEYFWQFTKGQTLQNKRSSLKEVPAVTEESIALAKQLKKDGFSFLGPTTCYAFMQATGMVNDHLVNCFRHKELA